MANNKQGCFILIVVAALLLFLAGGAWYSLKRYKELQKKIAIEITQLKPFDRDSALKEAAAELKLSLPVQKTELTEKQVRAASNKELKEIARKNVLSSLLSLKTKAIIKKYAQAKEGDKISFILNTTGQRVKGIYKGTFSDWKGKFIKVDHNKYRIYDIGLESHYYFDATISRKRAAEEIAGLKREFNENRKKIVTEYKNKILAKHFLAAGYRKQGEKWKPNIEVYEDLVKEKENRHKQKAERLIEAIYDDNKLFGLITVAPEEDLN